MSSLKTIVQENSPLLLLDAASARIQVGLFGEGPEPRWQTSGEEAGVGVFRCLESLAIDIGRIRGFAFCEGPGSILGIRTTAMALRTWNVIETRPMFAYCSLAVVAQALGRAGLGVIADARRGAWHHLALGSKLHRIAADGLRGDLVMPEGFRHWTPLPEGVGSTPYGLDALFALPAVADAGLFRPVAEPDAFLHEEPAYATWSPQIHRPR